MTIGGVEVHPASIHQLTTSTACQPEYLGSTLFVDHQKAVGPHSSDGMMGWAEVVQRDGWQKDSSVLVDTPIVPNVGDVQDP